MKATVVLSISAIVVAIRAGSVIPKPYDGARTTRNQDEKPKVVCFGPGGRVPDVPGHAPLKQEILDPNIPKGAKRVKMRYGPYSVPGMMEKSIMGESGSLWNCADDKIPKPCEECVLFRLQAGLEYPNGTSANIDSGMWLHHMVSFSVGPGRWDPTCHQNNKSLPHFAIGSDAMHSERNFASGNERTPADLTDFIKSGKKLGYFLRKTDEYRYIVDLMNMNMKDEIVYVTMTYDFFDGPMQDGWTDLQPVWLDADQCGMSDIHPPKNKGAFTISSKPWTPNVEGEVIGIGTHLHDGGTTLQIVVDNSTEACHSVAKYGETPEYIYKMPASRMHGPDVKIAEKHISSMSTCYFNEVGVKKIDKKQSWVLKAEYNYDEHSGNWEDGEPSEIMAISIVFVTAPRDRKPPF